MKGILNNSILQGVLLSLIPVTFVVIRNLTWHTGSDVSTPLTEDNVETIMQWLNDSAQFNVEHENQAKPYKRENNGRKSVEKLSKVFENDTKNDNKSTSSSTTKSSNTDKSSLSDEERESMRTLQLCAALHRQTCFKQGGGGEKLKRKAKYLEDAINKNINSTNELGPNLDWN